MINVEKIRVTANGNVGIGTANPVALLNLNGTTTGNSALIVPRSTLGTRPEAPANGA